MQQKDILETFKKYVGDFGLAQKMQIPLCKTQRIQNFGESKKCQWAHRCIASA